MGSRNIGTFFAPMGADPLKLYVKMGAFYLNGNGRMCADNQCILMNEKYFQYNYANREKYGKMAGRKNVERGYWK